MNKTILTINGMCEFEQHVLLASRSTPVLVDFWADWCSPCLFLAPSLEAVTLELAGKVLLAKLNTEEDENLKLAGRYKVSGFPTVILIQNGEELARFTGNQTQAFIRHFLKQNRLVSN